MRRTDLPIANLCPRKYATLEPIDEARGHCDDCNLTVHNLSALREDEALAVWNSREGHFCVNYKCDAEGNILFADTPRKPSLVPATRLTAARKAATLAASLVLAACGDNTGTNNPGSNEWRELGGPAQVPDTGPPAQGDAGKDAAPQELTEWGGVVEAPDAGPTTQPDAGSEDTGPPAQGDAGADGSST